MAEPNLFSESDTPFAEDFILLRDDKLSAFPSAKAAIDPATLLGLIASIALVLSGIFISAGSGVANFYNLPSILIVVLGTLTVTCISFNIRDFGDALPMIGRSLYDHALPPSKLGYFLTDLASLTRKKGVLAMDGYASEWATVSELQKAMQLIQDGTDATTLTRQLDDDSQRATEGTRIAALMLRRAAETAPGMGLLGTLIGLVQMLSQLDDPSTIGPAMAVALLTTFYGAFMSTVVLAPLAAKIERKLDDYILLHRLIKAASLSILKQENPRYLEAALNGMLPERERFKFFYH